MESIAAARDLGTWAAPARSSSHSHEHNKENVHPAAAPAAPYGGSNPQAPRYRPLVELPNGRGGGRIHRQLYPTPPAAAAAGAASSSAAACSPSAAGVAASAAAAWGRGDQFGRGGAKDVFCVGGPSGRRGHYQRSASDVASAACGGGGGGFAAEGARRPRSGVGARTDGFRGRGGRRPAGGGVASSASDEMHLAAVAVGRARRARLSSRF